MSTAERVERRLAAILAADVARYSLLMATDEEGTHARLQNHFSVLVNPKIREHRGRIVKNTGDGILAEFPSVVDAIRYAVELQRGMVQRNSGVPKDKRIEFRIGINVGDIIIERDDIFGDDVNMAARLEGIAEPGGICISEHAHRQVRAKLDLAFDDMGEHALKNMPEPVRVYRVRLNGAAETQRPVLPLPDKPSIAVLPFQNLNDGPEQDYFCDGIVEEIITALSRFRELFVIARNSSFSYGGRTVDVRRVGRELGVRYVLQGSIRTAKNRVRIATQLIDASTTGHLWADRVDGVLEDIFDLEEQVTRSVVGQIAPKLERAEIDRARRKPTANLDAHDYYLRGLAITYQMTKEANVEAIALFNKAIEQDSDFASPYAGLALLYSIRKLNGWIGRPEEIAEAICLASRAADLAQDDAAIIAAAGFVLAYIGRDLGSGAALVDRALSLNENLASAWGFSGLIKICLGEPAAAIKHCALAMRLSPLDPRFFAWQISTAFAHLCKGRYDDAAQWAGLALRDHSDGGSLRIAAASYALAGRIDEARQVMARLRALDPIRRISNLHETLLPLQRPEDRLRFADGLRKAGLPE